MVDLDKVKDRVGRKKKREGSVKKKKREKTGGGGGGGSKKTDIGSGEFESEMDKARKGMGLSSSEGDKVPRKHASKALECLGNILLYSEGTVRSMNNPSSPREEVRRDVAEAFYDHFTEIVSKRNIQAICERYGIDWEEDIIVQILENQDFEKIINDPGGTSSVVSIPSGEKFKRGHYHSILMAMGEIHLFAKMMEGKMSNKDFKEEKMAHSLAEDMVSEIMNFVGVFNVIQDSKKVNILWDRDVTGKLT